MRALLIVVALTACRDKEAPAPAPKVEPTTPAPAAVATPAPALPGIDSGVDPRGLPPAEAFAAEETDRPWKVATERTLRTKLAKVPGVKVDCRQSLCEIVATGDAMKAIDQIRQLDDIAQSVTLTQPAEGELRAYLRFDRADQTGN
jgi:hypothetical protein